MTVAQLAPIAAGQVTAMAAPALLLLKQRLTLLVSLPPHSIPLPTSSSCLNCNDLIREIAK